MRIMKWLLAGVLSSLFFSGAAQAAGKGYTELATPQPTDSGNKVEVIEFFGYGCPHCYGFDPGLQAWVKSQGDKIVFKRVPLQFHKPWLFHQKLFYSMEALGKTAEWHDKIFKTIYEEHKPLNTEESVIAFAVAQGVDKQTFLGVWSAFSMGPKLKHADKMQQDYQANESPMIVIGGRYVTSPSIAGESVGAGKSEPEMQAAALKVMTELVGKAKKK
jgi:thiol:disulfide interchange protein DsbA